MNYFPFLALSNDLRIEIIKHCTEKNYVSPFEKYISLLNIICNLSLVCKELHKLLSSKKQLLINYSFNKPAASIFKIWESQIWEREERLSSFSHWKNYMISSYGSVYEYCGSNMKLILKASELSILEDYLIDVKGDRVIIYESLEPIISHTVMGEFIGNIFRQIDGDIFIDSFTGLRLIFSKNSQTIRQLNSEILIKKNRSYYQGIKIPVPGEWKLYFRKGDVSLLDLEIPDYDMKMFLALKENRILWIELVARGDDLYYVSNGFLTTYRKTMDICSEIELNSNPIITLNKEGGYTVYYPECR